MSVFCSLFSLAGPGSSGGGGAYVCRDRRGRIQKSILVDLWEAQNFLFDYPTGRQKLNIKRTHEKWESQFDKAMTKLATVDHDLADQVRKELKAIQSNVNYLSPEIEVAIPPDLLVGYFPAGCPPEGMMRYDGLADHLDIKNEIFSKLETQTDVAAAWTHEAIYKVFRDRADQETSVKSRHLNACLYSNTECLKKTSLKSVLAKSEVVFYCTTPRYDYYVVPFGRLELPIAVGSSKWQTLFSRIGEASYDNALYYEKAIIFCGNINATNRVFAEACGDLDVTHLKGDLEAFGYPTYNLAIYDVFDRNTGALQLSYSSDLPDEAASCSRVK